MHFDLEGKSCQKESNPYKNRDKVNCNNIVKSIVIYSCMYQQLYPFTFYTGFEAAIHVAQLVNKLDFTMLFIPHDKMSEALLENKISIIFCPWKIL